ncbi:hypothetical protein Cgig2_025966 [Carnegiea gigantea]|uniref:RNase H type-1 domain-containing protein n=1 Tax=Carnegiea gigantea TaxID=171969 RepID=A0A9Q1JZN8_9CARY|nr:hypothetical protein Cgig2_025966 [Carnegiea gigantea]
MWECWNARNRFVLAARAMSFYQQLLSSSDAVANGGGPRGVPPSAGVFKLNFDAGRAGDEERGWEFVIRDHLGDIVLAGVKQDQGFQGAELEEARECLFALRKAVLHGFTRLVVEGDCISLIDRLKAKEKPSSAIGFFISDILLVSTSFEFISWAFVRREGNSVAHAIIHFQPINLMERIWEYEIPDSIIELATKDV